MPIVLTEANAYAKVESSSRTKTKTNKVEDYLNNLLKLNIL